MGRNRTIDIAKAICIILVVIGHYLPNNSPQWYQFIHDIIYSFHMPLFLFASGYIYISTLKKETYGNFIVRKVKRLMVPYLSTSVIIITVKLLTQTFSNAQVDHPVGLESFIRMFYLPEAGYFLWFVWALWWMFVLTPLFRTKKQRNVLFGVALLCAFSPFPATDVFCLVELKKMYVYFMLGVFVYENQIVKYVNRISPAFIYLLFVILESLYIGGFGKEIVAVLLPFVGIATVILFSRSIAQSQFGRIKTQLFAVAASSYIVYLFHTTFEGFAKSALRMVPSLVDVTDNIGFAVGALIVIIVGVLFPIVLHKYVLDKNRVFKFLFGLK